MYDSWGYTWLHHFHTTHVQILGATPFSEKLKWELRAAEFHDNIGGLEDGNGQNPSAIPSRILHQLLLRVGAGFVGGIILNK